MKESNDYIKLIEKLREEKDMDELANLFMNVISLAGLMMDETASLLYYIQKQTVEAPHNAKFLKERLDLDVKTLGVEGVLQVQRALVSAYVDKLGNNA